MIAYKKLFFLNSQKDLLSRLITVKISRVELHHKHYSDYLPNMLSLRPINTYAMDNKQVCQTFYVSI